MANETQNLNADSKERWSILSEIASDKSTTLEECLNSYLKITDEKSITEKSLQNLSSVLEIKGFKNISIQELKNKLLGNTEDEDAFLVSNEYKFIKQFSSKYGNKVGESELKKLQELLLAYQYDFSINKLKDLIDNEYWDEIDEFIELKVFINNPSTLTEAIRCFLENCDSKDVDLLISFAFVLKRRRFEEVLVLETSELVPFVEEKINQFEKQIELKLFEQQLNEETKHIWLEDVDRFTGGEFENFLKELFSKMGYRVKHTKISGDQGADLVVVKLGEKTVVQAKCYNGKVGNKAIQEVLGAMGFYVARKGMVITNNYFTSAAIELAKANGIELLDRDDLEDLINRYW